VKITVNGKAYYDALDTNATNVPNEEGWPEPTLRSVGKGYQAVYEVEPSQAAEMAQWLWERGDMLLSGGVDGGTEDGRACIKASTSIRAQMAKAGVTA